MKLDFKFEFSELSKADLNLDAIYKRIIFNISLFDQNLGPFKTNKYE